MKFSLQLFFLGAAFAAESKTSMFVPTRISFEDLAKNNEGGDDAFWKTLREVGLLSVTDIPGFDKKSMLNDLEDCLHHQHLEVGAPDFNLDHLATKSKNNSSGNTHETGNRRRTLATRTLDGTPDDILVATTRGQNNLCSDLQASSQSFRSSVQKVSEAIAAKFGKTESIALRGDHKLQVQQLINEGEHLEHFHSYYSEEPHHHQFEMEEKASTASKSIDWHTDQGMMLIFTPGQQKDGTIAGGFFIKLKDGSTVEVDFDSEMDDLVIMLGDGVHQYINHHHDESKNLRAVPHAVQLPQTNNDGPRLWYGRMVLPPPEAVHPKANGSTFSEIRTAMIQGDQDALALGCASRSEIARELMDDMHMEDGDEDLKCDESTSMLCWMKCMSFEELGVSTEDCASESDDHELFCANEGGELWKKGVHNPDFSVRCLSKLEVVEPEGTVEMEGGHDMGDDHDHSSMEMDSASSTTGFLFGTLVSIFGMVAMI